MTLTRLRPFGQRRKTYFYGVAGFVLAAHVVVGGIVYVMPPPLDQDAPPVAGVEMQIVDRLLSGDAIETGAVEMIEQADETALSFEPVWQSQPRPFVPDLEPIGPTVSDLPPLVVLFEEDEKAGEVETPKKKPEVAVAAAKPKSTSNSKPKTTSSSSSKKSTTVKRRTVTRSRPRTPQVKPAPAPPKPVEIPRAVPTNRPPEKKTGLLDRLREKRERK